jgi:primosomal protein N' (replication factor Y)
VAAVVTHDYDGFARGELAAREETGYPPFARMIVLRIDARAPDTAQSAATAAAEAARRAGGAAVRVRGPAPAPIERLRGRTRWQVWLSSTERAPLVAAARAGAAAAGTGDDLRVAVDVDPHSVL